MDFTIVRDIIKIKDIKEAKILEDGIAYIRLSEFRENTAKELQNKLKKLTSEGMLALIIDLRNNPGGLLSAAVDVAEQFIEKNKIVVSTQGRDEEKKIEFKSGFNNPLIDIPAVVMINEGSASGSEILAGCLQDYKRAIILGTKSFGKGSVQTLIPLADGSAIKLTTSIYFTPAGRMIHEKGIMPDILVEKMEIKKNEEVKDDPNLAGEIFDKLEDENAEHKKEEGYRQDNQILAAIDVLKAVLIYKNNEK